MLENSLNMNEQKEKSMKLIKKLGILLFILLIIFIGLIVYIKYTKATEFKVTVDEEVKTGYLKDTFIIEDDTFYMAIKDVSKIFGEYTYNNGEYLAYSEDEDSCYIESIDEVATYTNESNKIVKVILDNKETNGNEEFEMSKKTIKRNDKLYAPIDGIAIGFNIYADYSKKTNTLTVYTLDKLIKMYADKIEDSIYNDKDISFSSKKALLYDFVVVKSENELYGINTTEGKEIIGKKYKTIKFIESSQEFLVTTANNQYGIINKNGQAKISPKYDSIKKIDEKNELYLVSQENKYGVINGKDDAIIYIEYDKIGIEKSDFRNDKISNEYLLYNKLIPVKKAERWGLFDITGRQVAEVKYLQLGCLAGNTENKLANALLLMPDYEAIVVQDTTGFGLINSEGKELIPCATQNFYTVSNAGTNTYYLTYQGNTMNVVEYLDAMGIKPINEEKKITVTDSVEETNNTKTNNTSTNNTGNTSGNTSNNNTTVNVSDNTGNNTKNTNANVTNNENIVEVFDDESISEQ